MREPRAPIRTSEDVVVNAVGRDLYEKFFRGYTRKQWGLDPSQLSASVAARVPTRTNHDDRYFTDTFQNMPLEGYTRLFERMLDHRASASRSASTSSGSARRCTCGTSSTPARSTRTSATASAGCRTGRSASSTSTCGLPQYQRVGTVNYPNDHDFTRITEFSHLTGQIHAGTSIVREYPCDDGDPYYPVPRPENEALFKRYEMLAKDATDVTFVGRLAQYRYYNMDQCVGAALKAAETLVARFGRTKPRVAEGSAPRVVAPVTAGAAAAVGLAPRALPGAAVGGQD